MSYNNHAACCSCSSDEQNSQRRKTVGISRIRKSWFSGEREYDTHLILEDKSLGDRTIRVSFSKDDSVDTILKVLSDILPISIRKGNKVYYINQKQ